jgi:membrane protein implicated in regulation of membrane protease activity
MSDLSTGDFVEGLLFYPIALVISATICPGLTLCIPGLILLAVFVIVPLAALALVVAVVGALFAAPFVLVRVIRGLGQRRSASKSRPHVVDPSTAFGRPRIALSADRGRSHLASARSSR